MRRRSELDSGFSASWRIDYRVDGQLRSMGADDFGDFESQDLRVLARSSRMDSSETPGKSLSVVSKRYVRVERCVVTLRHRFAHTERVLMNGYQSWTDTAELPATSRMRGLARPVRAVARAFALDALGDYRFTRYEDRPGCQHGWTYAHFRVRDACLLIGSLDESGGFTLLRSDAQADAITLEPELGCEACEPGVERELVAFAFLAGTPDEVYGRWLGLCSFTPRRAPALVGYSSWYRHYDAIDAGRIRADLAGAAKAFSQLEAPDTARVFQIDDGWCKIGDWTKPDTAKFPEGIAPLAREIRKEGFTPGLWLAPFVCEKDSQLFAEHADWLLRDSRGRPVRSGPHWSGGYALDATRREVLDYVARALHTVTDEWGFGFLKLDFLYAACLERTGGRTRGQLMRAAMRHLRDSVGADVLIDTCGVPLASAFGLADYCRIGCDVGLDWDDRPHMRLLHRERVSTKRSLRNTLGRAPLDGRAFRCDPDVVFLRNDVKLSARRRERLLEADAACAGVLLTSDDMGAWDASQLAAYQAGIDTLLP